MYIKYSNDNMKQTIIISLLLLMSAATHAQRVPCAKGFYPNGTPRHATRAEFGKPTQYVGSKRGLIILMEFPNLKFINKNKNGKTFDVHDMWNDLANKENLKAVNGVLVNGSIRDYFVAQSYGKFAIDFDVKGPYTAKNKYAYYGRNVDYGDVSFDDRPYELIIEACKAADPEVDFKDYDWDGDGEVDQVYVVYAGHGEASYDDPELIWPHESSISGNTGAPLTLQGMNIDTYACGNELDSSDRIFGIGTICHEFSHCLGLPDVYDIEYSGETETPGQFDLMDAGNYNGDSWYPAGYSAFERMFCGWLEPRRVGSVADVGELQPLHLHPDAAIIEQFEGSTNYYLVENRVKESWDKFLPSHGLIAWHINYDLEVWKKNRVNVDPNNMGITIVDLADVPSYGTAISAPEKTDSRPVAWYDVSGRQLKAQPDKAGIYIVRYADGTTQKMRRF